MSNNDSFQEPTTNAFEQMSATMSHIKGWAIDANKKNEPTYPLRKRFEGDQSGYNWSRPTQQSGIEGILKSNERPFLSSVFGTSTPASNLSGAIRRYAFRFSEGRYRHWLLLLLADRIGVVEGLMDDIFHANFPHCLDERGTKAAWKHDRKSVLIRAGVTTLVIGSIAFLLLKNKD